MFWWKLVAFRSSRHCGTIRPNSSAARTTSDAISPESFWPTCCRWSRCSLLRRSSSRSSSPHSRRRRGRPSGATSPQSSTSAAGTHSLTKTQTIFSQYILIPWCGWIERGDLSSLIFLVVVIAVIVV